MSTPPIPPDEWSARIQPQPAGSHVFPPRPEVVTVAESDLVEGPDDPVQLEGNRPSDAPLRPTPELLPSAPSRVLWRRPPGQVDDVGEPTSTPIPPGEWNSSIQPQRAGSGHVFPPRPEVVVVAESDLVERRDGPVQLEAYRPDDAPLRPTPELLRAELYRAPIWRRPAGQEDEMGEPTTIFPPDTRTVIFDTAYPWRTCGRVATPGGSASGVMVGRRHMMTASHAIPWLAGGGADWVTFTPMQYDTSTPFGSAHATRIYAWQQVNGADGIQSNEAAFDYVVCVLNTPIGETTGHMGSRAYDPAWNGQAYWAHIGYPFDIGASVRPVYTTNGVMDSTVSESSGGRNSFRIMHRNDIVRGHSGGPFFGWWTGENGPSVVASQSAENWGMAGGPNAAGGGNALPQLILHALTVEP